MAIVVGFCAILLFFFVPETFWDRTPRPKSKRPNAYRSFSNVLLHPLHKTHSLGRGGPSQAEQEAAIENDMTPRQHMLHDQNTHAHFESALDHDDAKTDMAIAPLYDEVQTSRPHESDKKINHPISSTDGADESKSGFVGQNTLQTAASLSPPQVAALPRKKFKPSGLAMPLRSDLEDPTQKGVTAALPAGFTMPNSVDNAGALNPETDPSLPHLHNLNSPWYVELEKSSDYLSHHTTEKPVVESKDPEPDLAKTDTTATQNSSKSNNADLEKSNSDSIDDRISTPRLARYTTNLRQSPPKSYSETLRPWNGRLSKANWFRVALRPFILYAYPSVLWSALVYSLSIGWLIVLSESISNIYKRRDTYNFTSLQAGLVYVSPFIGGILGTVVAGRVSDVIVRYMAKKNGGVYEPEFRLVMAAPVAITTTMGLMGFGWSAQERDRWIVPTFFFGVISFGCSLGSTTAITFCVDSYRQYAGEALVTLNFSKNIFHGLVFSLFFANWLESEGPKSTFVAIGGIQLACMFFTIPMYVYGKRARMWTVRQGFMEKF